LTAPKSAINPIFKVVSPFVKYWGAQAYVRCFVIADIATIAEVIFEALTIDPCLATLLSS
jgi:hypothetical protein